VYESVEDSYNFDDVPEDTKKLYISFCKILDAAQIIKNHDAFVSKIAKNNLCKEVCGLMWAPPIPHTILVAGLD
jgi:hypothetical protein